MSQRDTDLKKLVDFGFENDLVEEAYEKYSGDYEKALNFLLEFHSEKDFQKYEKRKGKYLEWDYLKIKSPLFRSGAATCRSKDKFYIFGGVAVSKHLNDLHTFDFKTQQWIELFSDSSKFGGPTPRILSACCIIGEYFYVVGGQNMDFCLDDIYSLNLRDLTWKQIKIDGYALPLVSGHSVVERNGDLYVIGGQFDRLNEIFNKSIIKFEILKDGFKGTKECNLPLEIASFGTCLSNNKLYILGGLSNGLQRMNTVFEYDFENQDWKKKKDLPHNVYFNHAFSLNNNSIICFGGANEENVYNYSIHLYDIKEDDYRLVKEDDQLVKLTFDPMVTYDDINLYLFNDSKLHSSHILRLVEDLDELLEEDFKKIEIKEERRNSLIIEESEKKSKVVEEIKNSSKDEIKWRNFTEETTKLKNYKKSKAFGVGTFGRIWMALKKDKDIVALKEIICENPNLTNICISECLNAMKLNHPNILKYNDVFSAVDEDEGIFKVFIETEFYPLGDLSKFIKTYGIDEPLMIDFCNQILDGIEYIHSNGVIHRDLKPENILIKLKNDQDLHLTICDFGSSKNQGSMMIGSFAGTETYVAPEIMKREEVCTEKVDIFSFGALLYTFLTRKERRFYFEIIENESKLINSIKNDIENLSLKNKDIYIDVILSCLSKDPHKRPDAKKLKEIFSGK